MSLLSTDYSVYASREAQEVYSSSELKQGIKEINDSVGWSHYSNGIIRSLCDPNSLLYFLGNENGLAGYVQARRARCSLYVPFIAVKKSEQNKKYGKILIQQIFDVAIKNSLNVTLNFRYNNEKTLAFYTTVSYEKEIRLTGRSYNNGDPMAEASFFTSKLG